MVGVDGHRHGDAQLIARRVDLRGHVPQAHGAVRGRAALGAGDLDDEGGVGLLRRLEGAVDDEAAAAETLADFEASELVADFAPPEPEHKPDQEVEEPEEFTIESYLTGLLAYDPQSAATAESAEEVTDVSEAPTDSDDVGPEDLEQFQNWLRSLKR